MPGLRTYLWNKDEGYSRWYAGPQGQGALAVQRALARHMVSGWQRRGRNLLELNCGSGYFLEDLFHAGFDVSGQESAPKQAGQAEQLLRGRAVVFKGRAEALPYEDNSFSYVVCLHCFEEIAARLKLGDALKAETARELFHEALRVAECGVLLGFYSRFSLSGLAEMFMPGRGRALPWVSPLGVLRGVYKEEKARGARVKLVSSLTLPRRFWNLQSVSSPCGCFCPLPLGAFVMLRLDFGPAEALTGLPVFAEAGTLSSG